MPAAPWGVDGVNERTGASARYNGATTLASSIPGASLDMQRGKDIAATFPGLFLVHHNLPGSVATSHAHAEHHLIIPLQGEISVELRNKTLSCGPGRMVYVPPATDHAFRSARDKGERLICMLDAAAWERAEAGRFPPAILPASQLCKELLFHLLLHQKTKNAAALIDVLTRTLAEILAAPAPETSAVIDHAESSVNRPELRKAIALAREHCTSDLSVAELARRSGLSTRNLSRLLQIELGLTPKQLLIALRIEKAKELLLAGHATVTETAFAVGYSSLSQFITSFRQLTGQIPSEYARAVTGLAENHATVAERRK